MCWSSKYIVQLLRLPYNRSLFLQKRMPQCVIKLLRLPYERSLFLHKKSMLQCGLASNPPIRIVLQKLRQEIDSGWASQRVHGDKISDRTLPPLRELSVVVRKAKYAGPHFTRRCSAALKDFEYLVTVTGPSKKTNGTGKNKHEGDP
jgi:hypothetical protein